MVSLIGCFTVTILSFILPAYLHLQLVTKPQLELAHGGNTTTSRLRSLSSTSRLRSLSSASEGGEYSDIGLELSGMQKQYGTARKMSKLSRVDEEEQDEVSMTTADSVLSLVTTPNAFNLSPATQYYVDILSCVMGVAICVIATTVTSLDTWSKLQSGALC